MGWGQGPSGGDGNECSGQRCLLLMSCQLHNNSKGTRQTASSTGSVKGFLRGMGPLSQPPGTGLSPRCWEEDCPLLPLPGQAPPPGRGRRRARPPQHPPCHPNCRSERRAEPRSPLLSGGGVKHSENMGENTMWPCSSAMFNTSCWRNNPTKSLLSSSCKSSLLGRYGQEVLKVSSPVNFCFNQWFPTFPRIQQHFRRIALKKLAITFT